MRNTHIKATLIVLPLLLIGLYSLYTFTERNKEPISSAVDIGQPFPPFEAEDIRGTRFSSVQVQNKIVIVNFWATWCAPCIEEIPSLMKLINEFKGQIVLVGISADYSMEEIETFKKSFPGLDNENIVLIWDKDKSLMKRYNIAKLPESFILDKRLTLIKKISGTINWFNDNSISYFKELLN